MTDFCLGEWTVRPHRNCIERDGETVHLAPKAMAVLQCLANAANSVVTRHELFEAVWPGAEVTDDALTQRISELRKAFGDSPHHAQIIQTIPKTGFRLVPEVVIPTLTSSTKLQPASQPQHAKWKKRAVLLAFAALITAASVSWYWFGQDEDNNAIRRTPSVAILPFVNRSDLPGDENLVFGIHSELLTSLSKNPLIKVTYSNSLLEYADRQAPLSTIAEELGVTTIVQGSLQRMGERLRVQVQLIDPYVNESLWADTFDSKYSREGIFIIQTSIARSISSALHAKLSAEVDFRLSKPMTASLEASESFWEGQRLMATRNIEDLVQARQKFERAIEIDPEYPLAWVGLADVIGLLRDRGELRDDNGEKITGLQGYQKSIDAAQKALALDEELGEAYASLGSNLARMMGNLQREDLREEAVAAYRKAIKLSPSYAPAYHAYAYNLLDTYRDNDLKLELFRKAAELDPRSSIIQYAIAAHLREVGRFDEAMTLMRRVLRFEPNVALAHLTIGSIHAINGRVAEAVRSFREAEQLDTQYWMVWRYMTDANLALSDDEAFHQTRARLERHRGAGDVMGYIADFWAVFQQKGWRQALDWLDHPDWANKFRWVRQILRPYTYVVAGDYHAAYQHLLAFEPRWAKPEEWPELIIMQRNGGVQNFIDPAMDSCLPAGIFIGAGEEMLGKALLRESLEFLENELPLMIMDSDRFWGLGLCYLVEGSYEKAFDFFEQYIEHGHYSHVSWIWIQQLPWWNPVRDDPRYISMMNKVDEMRTEQRKLLQRQRNGEA